jgi:DNA-binding SARP family transcriptional activator/tetratricopeptide (TPR) repeat protein
MLEPVNPSARIARPALAHALASALDAGDALVVAGAGFGKTTAVEEALAGRSWRVAWIGCGFDDDADRLLLRLVHALRRASPEVGSALAAPPAGPGGSIDALGAGRALLGDLATLLVEPLVLVLDDAERLSESPSAIAFVQELLAAGGQLRVAVLTRRRLPLRVAKLKAAGRVVEFGEADLTFSADECAELLRLRSEREPDADEVERVLGRTLGWPLGIAMTGADDGHARRLQSGADVSAFVSEEVLDALDGPTRAAMLTSSVPPELTPELLEPLGLPPDLAAQAGGLGLVVRPVEGRDGAHAYHPLFREVLLERFTAEHSVEAQHDAYAAVAPVLARDGRIAEAIDLLVAAQRWGAVLATMGEHVGVLLRTASESVARWLDALPSDAVQVPLARLLRGQLAYSSGQHEEAVTHLRAALHGFRGLGDRASEWSTRFVLAECLWWTGQFDDVAALADGFEEALGEVPGPTVPITAMWGALALSTAGRLEQSDALAARVLASYDDEFVRGLDLQRRWQCLAPAGRAEEIDALIREEAFRPKGYPHFDRATGHLALATFLRVDEGRPEEALEFADAFRAAVERDGLVPYMLRLSRALRALPLAVLGRHDEALLEIAPHADERPRIWADAIENLVRALAAADAGRLEEAAEEADRAIGLIQPSGIFWRQLAAVIVAPIVGAAGRPGQARAAVERVLADVDACLPGGSGSWWRARLLMARAATRWTGGDEPGAVEDLRAAWDSAGPLAPQLLRVSWPHVERLGWTALEGGVLDPDEAVAAIDRAFPAGAPLLELSEHPSAEVRAAVARVLAGHGHPEAEPRLEVLAGDADERVAGAAREAAEQVRRDPVAFELRVFGGFEVRRGRWAIPARQWERRIAERLVRFLLTRRGDPVSEDELFDAFWPGKDARQARASLQVAVSRARAVLRGPGDSSRIAYADRTYRLALEPNDRVDAEEFLRAADAALAASGPDRRPLLFAAARLWTGEPMPEERYESWARPWLDELHERYRAVLGAVAEEALAGGDHSAAVDAGRAMLALDPLDEGSHRTLMRAYARAGRPGQALRQYLECRRLLVDELGIEPAEETARLQREVLAGNAI